MQALSGVECDGTVTRCRLRGADRPRLAKVIGQIRAGSRRIIISLDLEKAHTRQSGRVHTISTLNRVCIPETPVHIALSRHNPNVADHDVRERQDFASRIRHGSRVRTTCLKLGKVRLPILGWIDDNTPALSRKLDSNSGARLSRSPKDYRLATLQDHVVGENGRQLHRFNREPVATRAGDTGQKSGGCPLGWVPGNGLERPGYMMS